MKSTISYRGSLYRQAIEVKHFYFNVNGIQIIVPGAVPTISKTKLASEIVMGLKDKDVKPVLLTKSKYGRIQMLLEEKEDKEEGK